jgi:hypothetical protein
MARPGFSSRRIGGRQVKGKRIGIVYDGELTEDTYFRGWQQILAQGRIRIFPAYVKSGGNPKVAVRAAISALRQDRDLHQMWCVTDVDDASPQDVITAIADAKKAGVNLCLSNRCFEIWLYCHFGKTTKPINNEDDAVSLIRAEIPDYNVKRKSLDFSILLPRTKDAIENADWLRQQQVGNPMTDVDHLVVVLAKALQ